MSAADQIRANAARVGAKTSTRSGDTGDRAKKTAAAVGRTKPIGKTVNLDAALNRQIRDWQSQSADRLGVARVTFQDVVDALLRELVDNETLAARVQERLDTDL